MRNSAARGMQLHECRADSGSKFSRGLQVQRDIKRARRFLYARRRPRSFSRLTYERVAVAQCLVDFWNEGFMEHLSTSVFLIKLADLIFPLHRLSQKTANNYRSLHLIPQNKARMRRTTTSSIQP